tara:strand:- start:30960 stop:32237 length:1278 start_codon:yes stop_codon:yes gene_type:complete
MITFWLLISLLLLLTLLIVAYGVMSSSKSSTHKETSIRKETNVNLYHEHLIELQRDLNEGSIDKESFEQLKMELDKSLLQDVKSEVPQVLNNTSSKFQTILWISGVCLFISATSVYFYTKTGAYELLKQPAVATEADPHANLNVNQMALLKVQTLTQKVNEEPNNSQAWFSLGHAYIGVGQYDNAAQSFDQVMSLIGEHAELLGPKAQALYYKNKQQINGEIQALVDKALSLDPIDASTNILLGMDSYAANDFTLAISYWQKVLDSGRPGVNTKALEGAIHEANNQLQITAEVSTDKTINTKKKPDNSPSLQISVSFSADILDKLILLEDKVVYIYAQTTTQGADIPLAAVKIYASELPSIVVLDDTFAVSDTMNLTSVDKVNIYAVVSMLGGAGISSGDFTAEKLAVDVNFKGEIEMIIDRIAP